MDKHFSEEIKAPKTDALIEVLKDRMPIRPNSILVVGCGSGVEAGMLARAFGAETVGTDIVGAFSFDYEGSAPAKLMAMDAADLRFPDGTFDLVFSFHMLEHVPKPERVLSEM